MAANKREVESPGKRARRIAREKRQKEERKKKRRIRHISRKRASVERQAKGDKKKELKGEKRELLESGICPTCKAPLSETNRLVWHHVLKRSLFPELKYDKKATFLGCEKPWCGNDLDTAVDLAERLEKIKHLLGARIASWARRKCRGRILTQS